MTDAGSPSARGMTLTSRAKTTYRWLALYLGWHAVIVIQAAVGGTPGRWGTGAMTSTCSGVTIT
jgi:hypothetical protein